ncbi:CreA family protein [Sansalvadorimonas sp. 2012CJ34-2]|uniref:CreA family protein n=1 Tax=Parendozoicomonas callyspongiae TaxID=2942213 RepID=A0ABT0PH80_9GAMM|nr:CreA family protein [Sansalvadorimonas sp. 2012CJ34-2]MCL6269863.1 CreA family protein [Sansalvadorimonas sp. 2012CJ34-2]
MKNLLFLILAFSLNATAAKIGTVETSGILFKDTITIESFNDPTIDGVACHVTSPDRALSFEDQTNASIACRQVKKTITGDFQKPAKNIFRKAKSFFFKTMTVDRFYDQENDTLVYIAYTKKLKGDNASHSISTVPLYLAR